MNFGPHGQQWNNVLIHSILSGDPAGRLTFSSSGSEQLLKCFVPDCRPSLIFSYQISLIFKIEAQVAVWWYCDAMKLNEISKNCFKLQLLWILLWGPKSCYQLSVRGSAAACWSWKCKFGLTPAISSNLWQYLAISGNLWQYLAISGNLW